MDVVGEKRAERRMGYTVQNVTFRVHAVDRDAIKRAAKKAGTDLSGYCRDVIVPYAYSELGERRPNLPPVERGSGGNLIDQAAKAAGVTRAQYMRRIAEEQAARDLGVMLPKEAEQKAALIRPRTMPRSHERAEPGTGVTRRRSRS